MRRAILKPEELKEPLQQRWSKIGRLNHVRSGYYDQYGFEIHFVRCAHYKLYWKDTFITETHSLQAAKEISLVLINDKIHSKQIDPCQ